MCKLETRNVFLDTEVYFRSGFNLNQKSLTRLKELCENKLLNLYITDIVKTECRSHLCDAIKKALSGLKTFQRQGAILLNIESEHFAHLFSGVDEPTIQQEAQSQFERFLSSCNAIEVSCSEVDPSAVFALYFSSSPPFGAGKKKSEFPDAFSFKAVAHSVGEEKCYLVSGDKDAEHLDSDNLLFVEGLEKFLDLYNRAEEAVTERLARAIKEAVDQLKREIKEGLEDYGAYSDLELDAEVTDFTVDKVTLEEIFILSVGLTSAELSVNATIDYTAMLQEPAYDTATYDREDDLYIFHEDPHVYSGNGSESVRISVTVDFTDLDDELEIEIFSGIAVEGKDWGFPVRVERENHWYK